MTKKIRLSLGAVTALTAVATPLVTVISCGQKKEARNMIQINLDSLFEKAKKQSTDKDVANDLVQKKSFDENTHQMKLDKNSKRTFFNETSAKYIDPLYTFAADILESFMEGISKQIPEMKPILKKLQKDNNFYKITKDVMEGILDSKYIEANGGNKYSIHSLLKGGIKMISFFAMSMTQTPSDLVLAIINSVWSATNSDLAKTGITVGEIGSLLKHLDGYKVGVTLTVNKQKVNLMDEKEIKIPTFVSDAFNEKSKQLLSGKMKEVLPMIKMAIPIFNLPKDPIGSTIMSMLGKMGGQAGGTTKRKQNPEEKIAASKEDKTADTIKKIGLSLKRIAWREITPMKEEEKFVPGEVTALLKKLGFGGDMIKFAEPLMNILGKVSELYSVK